MHFSLIQPLPQREREAAHERMRGGAYADHQWLWERVFAAPDRTPRDFLFRRLDGGVAGRFYAVSARAPRTDVPGWEVRLKRYEPRPKAGERLHFDLRANPVVSRGGSPQLDRGVPPALRATEHADSARRKVARHDVVMDAKKRLLAERGLKHWQDWTGADKPPLYELAREGCGRWLVSRGHTHGFALDEDSLRVEAYMQHRGKSGDRLRFSSVDLSGVLTVLDSERFRGALTQGVGHAKAFGCGLLLVRRLT
jgi:CRISPR system Cascade subunit CasE